MSRPLLPTLIAAVLLVAHQAGARQAGAAGDTAASAEISLASYDLLHQNSNIQSFDLSAQDYSIRFSHPLAGGMLSGRYTRTTLDFKSSGSKTPLAVSLFGKTQRLAIAYRASAANIGFESGGSLVDEHGHISFYGEAGATLRFPLTILEEIRLGISEQALPFDFRTVYLDSELPLTQSLRQTVIETAVSLSPFRSTGVTVEYRFSGSAPTSEQNPFLMRDNTETHHWHGVVRQNLRNVELSLSYERITAFNSTDFFRGGTTFGEFSLSGVKSEEAMIGCAFPASADSKGTSIEAGYRMIEGTLIGDLQSWPFLSIMQSVIANRIYYRLGGSVKYWRAGIGHTLSFETFSVRPCVTYYDVRPDLGIQTWQPLFLTIGVSKYADNQLDVIHAGLAQLELAVKLDMTGISAELYATQFVPLFQTRRTVQGGTGGGPSGPAAEPARTTGGRWVRVTVRSTF